MVMISPIAGFPRRRVRSGGSRRSARRPPKCWTGLPDERAHALRSEAGPGAAYRAPAPVISSLHRHVHTSKKAAIGEELLVGATGVTVLPRPCTGFQLPCPETWRRPRPQFAILESSAADGVQSAQARSKSESGAEGCRSKSFRSGARRRAPRHLEAGRDVVEGAPPRCAPHPQFSLVDARMRTENRSRDGAGCRRRRLDMTSPSTNGGCGLRLGAAESIGPAASRSQTKRDVADDATETGGKRVTSRRMRTDRLSNGPRIAACPPRTVNPASLWAGAPALRVGAARLLGPEFFSASLPRAPARASSALV